MQAAGALQVCAGQESGIEAAIHAMLTLFQADDTDAILLVDAENAFNKLNRGVALHNIRFLCPQLAIALINIYRLPARLFVTGGGELASAEGTTQGCPLAMAMYALGVVPLIDRVRAHADGERKQDPQLQSHDIAQTSSSSYIPSSAAAEALFPIQAWYADDSQAAGRLLSLRKW